MDARCCGIAGTYGLKDEKYDIAMEVGATLFAQVEASGAATVGVRQRDLPLADRHGDASARRCTRSTPAPRVRLSAERRGRARRRLAQQALAEGVVALAREMGGEELALEAAGGMDEPGALGTDAERVRAAIERAMSDDGVLVLMDLGSALMSAEMAIEMLETAASAC